MCIVQCSFDTSRQLCELVVVCRLCELVVVCRQKQEAVNTEDYVKAADLKQQIIDLQHKLDLHAVQVQMEERHRLER